MEKMFTENTRVDIVIKITNETIYFYYQSEILRHEKFIKSLDSYDLNQLSDDDKEVNNIYFIDNASWIDSFNNKIKNHNWEQHMQRKRWYTQEMNDFINKTLIKN